MLSLVTTNSYVSSALTIPLAFLAFGYICPVLSAVQNTKEQRRLPVDKYRVKSVIMCLFRVIFHILIVSFYSFRINIMEHDVLMYLNVLAASQMDKN